MSTTTKQEKRDRVYVTVFTVSLITAVLLLVFGFVLPPTGEIHNSVLIAVGLLLVWPISYMVPEAIRAGREISVSKEGIKIAPKSDE